MRLKLLSILTLYGVCMSINAENSDSLYMGIEMITGAISKYDVSDVKFVENQIRIISEDNVSKDTTTIPYVDLGLPSGTMWAAYNIGASSPEEYGDYFSWGETQAKDEYPYVSASSYDKYNDVDSITSLLPEDDAATVNFKADWKMPTIDDWTELLEGTKCEWTSINGVKGMKAISKHNKNWIFFPFAGYRYKKSLNDTVEYGNYWSADLSLKKNMAYYLKIDNHWGHERYVAEGYRYYGYTIRPVRVKNQYSLMHVNQNNDSIVTYNTDSVKQVFFENNSYEGVDLELPSGTIWSTYNIGANNPEDVGDFFAWGETEPKESFSKNNYKWFDIYEIDKKVSYRYTNKYFWGDSLRGLNDSLTVLLPKDDAASVNWGSIWRMPTMEEWGELESCCDWEWTSINGKEGYKVSGQNGKWIFFPVTGCYQSTGMINKNEGCYWTSSIEDDFELAYIGNFWKDAIILNWSSSFYRSNGAVIRPVRSKDTIVDKMLDQNVVDAGLFPLKFSILPDSSAQVIRIELDAWTSSYNNLENVDIPSSVLVGRKIYPVTRIGDRAFRSCNKLNEVTIPPTVTSIGKQAFSDSWLKSITIPSTVNTIEESAFNTCNKLSSIIISEGVSDIKPYAFYSCGLKEVTIPGSVKTIKSSTFAFSLNLTQVNIEEGVTRIETSAFWNCISLDSVNIPFGVTYIGELSFSDCSSLRTIVIPSSVDTIGSYAFGDCNNLINLTISEGVKHIGDYAFQNSNILEVEIPSTVYTIGSGAFSHSDELTTLKINEGVKYIGDYAFYYCRSLKSIEIPSGASIGDKSFYNCLDMTNLTISEGVTTIGIDAFNGCSKLTSVIIPSSVTTIKKGAFADCKNLDVVIDNSKENVDFASNAFNGCKSVTYLK